MPVTSYHEPTKRWLTYFGEDAKPGDEPCISIGHPLWGGEFTTYRLGPVVAQCEKVFKGPLFDLDEAEIKMNGSWFPASLLRQIRREHTPCGFILNGVRYRDGAFGIYRVENEHDRPPWRELHDYGTIDQGDSA